MVNLTQKSFNNFIEILNHRMTKIEMDVRWIKRIGYYLTGALSLAIGKFMIGL